MKKIIYAIALLFVAMGVTSCLGNGVEEQYKDWRKANAEWLQKQAQKLDENGKLYYTPVIARWDPNARVLVHWFNDRELTKNNLKPLYTSTVDVKYIGRIYTGEAFDSSFLSTSPRDSIVRMALNEVVEGWGIAVTEMRVGDSCRIVIDYPQGYGTYSKGTLIKPYSVLEFDIKLDDIYRYGSNL